MRSKLGLLFTLVAVTGSLNILSASEKIEQISADETMAKSERKVIMGIKNLGLEANRMTFPVYYTPSGKKAKTRYIGDWSVVLNNEFANAALADNYSFLIPNRYDKLVFGTKEAKILTATKNIVTDIGSVKIFTPMNSSYEDFSNQVKKYLNDDIYKKVAPVLSEAKEVRYSEMNAKEAETFMTTKAKEIGMPASILQSLVNSAYAFSVYMPKPTGKFSISQRQYKDSKGRIITSYSTSFNAPLTLYMDINQIKDDKFVTYKSINSKSNGVFEGIAKAMNGGSAISTSYMPDESYAQGIFEKAYKKSFRDNTIALSVKIKEDRSFAINAPLEEVGDLGLDAKISIGNQEDIRVDHPFNIYRTEDDKEEFVAYMKARKVGDSCLALPLGDRTKTEASVIRGFIEEADLAVEHPWSGVFGFVSYEQSSGSYNFTDADNEEPSVGTYKSDYDTGTGATKSLNIGFIGDLGYLWNSESLSEFWMSHTFGFGLGSYNWLPSYNDAGTLYTPSGGVGFMLNYKLGVEKRYHILTGLYVAGAIDLKFEGQYYGYSDRGSLSLYDISSTPAVKAGYMIDHNMDLYGSVGYNLPFVTGNTFGYTDDDDKFHEIKWGYEFDKQPGVNIQFGINIHSNFTGPFSSSYSKSSRRCDRLKTN